MEKTVTTSRLEGILKKTSPEELENYLNSCRTSLADEERPFSAYMRGMVKEKKLSQQELFVLADIPERYGYKLISGEKTTTKRDVILRLCFGGKFTLKETQRALKLYGMSELYAKIPRDAALIIALNSEMYEIHAVNSFLSRHGMSELAPCGAEL